MKGFSLLEILLTISIIVVISGIGIPLYYNLQIKNDLRNTVSRVVEKNRRAQSLSRASKNDTPWGINIEGRNVTLFSGATYDTRNGSFDETFQAPPSINFTTDQEYTYSKVSGELGAPITIEVEGRNEEPVTININEMGMIEY
jgi:prepilin-type N-terminal cleavage/methylation domain-containing protein